MRTLELPQELPPWAPHLFMCSSDTDLRAVKFLFSLLTPEQIESLEMRGYFEHVTGGGTRCYLFSANYYGLMARFTNRIDHVRFGFVYSQYEKPFPAFWGCVWTSTYGGVPTADSIATLLLWLKADETGFCRIVNWSPYRDGVFLENSRKIAVNARLIGIPVLSCSTLDMEPVDTMTVPVEMRR